MALYSSPNAYTPLKQSRIYDADVLVASIDKAIRTPPRTRLFRPNGFDPDKYLFRRDLPNLAIAILNDLYVQLAPDTRYNILYNQSVANDNRAAHTIQIGVVAQAKGLGNAIFRRTLTISTPEQP